MQINSRSERHLDKIPFQNVVVRAQIKVIEDTMPMT